MQKVEGSSPFIRLEQKPRNPGLSCNRSVGQGDITLACRIGRCGARRGGGDLEQGRDAVVSVLLALSAQNERLQAQVEVLTVRVARQDERIAQLERRLN